MVMPTVPNKDSCQLAMLAHLLGAFTSVLGPLIIWLMKRETDPFIDDQGKEALNFQITMLIGYAVATAISIVTCVGAILGPLVFVVDVIFSVLAGLQASKGEAHRYPFNLRLVK